MEVILLKYSHYGYIAKKSFLLTAYYKVEISTENWEIRRHWQRILAVLPNLLAGVNLFPVKHSLFFVSQHKKNYIWYLANTDTMIFKENLDHFMKGKDFLFVL